MDFWQWFALIIGGGFLGVSAVFAFRVNVSFDVNDWVKDRRKQKRVKIRDICPHTTIVDAEDGEVIVRSLLVSPLMSPSWVCSRCGMVDQPGAADPKAIAQYWLANPREYAKHMKEYQRLTAIKPRRWWTPWR